MKIIYQAFDGEFFTTAEECIDHERRFPKFKMWDSDGITTSPDSARVVWFSTQADARKDFISLCKSEDITAEGIDEDDDYDNQLYLWSDEMFQWIPMDELTINSVLRYCAEQ